ncbi:MAG: DUF1553 domain-containing protein, partial [Verrucomicrobiales bacterium]|nr:DUF1553 domain-containing protein [Verrucomicrobiales bacterium]
WNSVERYEVGGFLKKGGNVVQVVATNGASAPNPAGLLLGMRVELAGGEVVTVVSDGAWEVAESGAAVVLDGEGPWGGGVRAQMASKFGEKGADVAVRAALVKSTLLMRALGRPNREQVVTTRPADLTTLQALELNNGAEFVGLLERGAKKLIADGRAGSARELAEWLVPVALSRGATREEVALARSVIGAEMTARGVEDFLWMVLMLPEMQSY